MSSKDLALDLVVLRVLADMVKDAKTATAAGALSQMDPGDRTGAKLPDGTVVGAVAVNNGKVTAKIVDEVAFLKHVKATAPSEVVTVETVRPAYLAKLLDHVKTTGELLPGTDLAEGDPYTSVRPLKGAVEAITRAWADGSLPLPAVMRPALPEGGQS